MNPLVKFFVGNIHFQKLFEALHIASLYGMNYGNGHNFDHSGEKYIMQFLKRKFDGKNKPLIIFDAGANAGFYSLELMKVFPPETIVHAFEPSKICYDAMANNVKAFRTILPQNLGLGDKNESLTLYKDADYSGISSMYQRKLDYANIVMDKTEDVAISTIDSYCEKNNITEIDFLKMDIEGHEYKALCGARRMLSEKRIRYIQFEFGGTNIDSKVFFQDFWYLLSKDYNFYRSVRNGLYPIKAYKERFEIFKNINYLLELKA